MKNTTASSGVMRAAVAKAGRVAVVAKASRCVLRAWESLRVSCACVRACVRGWAGARVGACGARVRRGSRATHRRVASRARDGARAGAGEGACVAIGAIGCFLGFPDARGRARLGRFA